MRATIVGLCVALCASLVGEAAGQTPGEQGGERGASKPIVALAWSDSPQRSFDYVIPFMFVRTNTKVEDALAYTARQPEGYRALMWVTMGGDPLKHPEDQIKTAEGKPTRGIWFEHGEAQSTEATRNFFSKYKEMGGQLDYLVIDFENGLSVWHLPNESFAAIEADPRFAQENWAQRLGFSELDKCLVKERYKGDRAFIWGRVQAERVVAMLNRCAYGPVAELFPGLKASNYNYHYNTVGIPDTNGHVHERPATEVYHLGTHQSRSTYGGINAGLKNKKLNGTDAYGTSPYKSFLTAFNGVRGMLASSDVPIMPWVGYRGFARENVLMGNTDYYQENVIHAAMASPDVILYWNPRSWSAKQDPKQWCDDEQDALVSRVLTQVNGFIGYEGRQLVDKKPAAWDAPWVVTGVTVGSKTIWRFTPELELAEGVSVKQTVVPGEAATFKVREQTIAFPQGRIVEVAEPVSTLGAWIETPAGVEPVVR